MIDKVHSKGSEYSKAGPQYLHDRLDVKGTKS